LFTSMPRISSRTCESTGSSSWKKFSCIPYRLSRLSERFSVHPCCCLPLVSSVSAPSVFQCFLAYRQAGQRGYRASVHCHPAQLYEAIAYLVIFFLGLLLYKRYKAKIGTGLFMGYCLFTIFTFRFFVEFIKENQVAFEDGMTLIMGQWLSIPLIIVGAYFMIKGIKKSAQADFFIL